MSNYSWLVSDISSEEYRLTQPFPRIYPCCPAPPLGGRRCRVSQNTSLGKARKGRVGCNSKVYLIHRSVSSRDIESALKEYERILQFLEWGQKEWEDVPTDEKGVVFRPTFIVGIRRFYLRAYMLVRHIIFIPYHP